ncbi:hypothetical protein AMATHDRAFT_4614 [Amanita thiersii Skay4041]|uniref:C2H2-type domain-containing protein n=1 Tax=Amanita thiersii Skay4041 TaxID=703135 RepID=A0A2A9NI59_9AGAR|nr:hypothetical protein AMATHDRAFT_4614 [Amanita thiersii Skay4041]
MHHSRTYSYDGSGANYGHQIALQHSAAYTTSTAPYHQSSYDNHTGGAQYYAQIQPTTMSTADEQNGQYYQGMAPAIQQSSRYHVGNNADPRLYNLSAASSSIPVSSSSYGSPSPYYGTQYTSSMDQRNHHGAQFIPTPSELTQSYASYSRPVSSTHPPNHHPDQYATGHEYAASRGSLPHSVRVSTSSRPRTAAGTVSSPNSISSPTGERFPCEKCGKTFSRSHDRKRHHETQHLPSPVVHRCRYCEKEFSRQVKFHQARHLDNGCDEMP